MQKVRQRKEEEGEEEGTFSRSLLRGGRRYKSRRFYLVLSIWMSEYSEQPGGPTRTLESLTDEREEVNRLAACMKEIHLVNVHTCAHVHTHILLLDTPCPLRTLGGI